MGNRLDQTVFPQVPHHTLRCADGPAYRLRKAVLCDDCSPITVFGDQRQHRPLAGRKAGLRPSTAHRLFRFLALPVDRSGLLGAERLVCLQSRVSPHLSRASRTALASECRFFSIGHDNVSSLKESGARNAIARFSLSREETLSHVLATCDPESRFVIEDLSDWTAVKNLLVFLLSLKAAIQQGKEPLLSGFEYERAYRFFEGYLRKRGIVFNPYADSSLASAYDLFHDLVTSLLKQGDYRLNFGFNGYHEGDLMASNLESQLWLSLLDYKSMYLGICVYCGLPFFVKGKSRKCYCSHNCLQMMRKLQA